MSIKIRLKGHESFSLREGWLRKGLAAIENINMKNKENEDARDLFLEDNAIEVLGVGSNMVKSIKYWLQVCGLTEELRTKKGRRLTVFSKDFGEIINEKDPYFEDIFTLWLLHYKLVSNKENATTWYLFFNEFKVNEFTRSDLYDGLELSLKRLDPEIIISERSLHDDCGCLVKTYYANREDLKKPEENLCCPLCELNLLDKKITVDKREVFVRKKPRLDILHPNVILFVLLDRLNSESNTTIERLLNEDCNIGKVFNLDRVMINHYLDVLERQGYLIVNRTAGLDTIYLKDSMRCVDVINEYYEQLRRED